jgi:peptidoglycan/xylan/chitin deacetylase (PgdA/CDA1 family)
MRAVVTFHSLDDGASVLSFSPRRFAHFIESLLLAKVPVVSYGELLDRDHGVTLTFDDGMRSVHDAALPILREHRLPAHLFLTTDAVGRDNRWRSQPARAPTYAMLDWKQVEACAGGGILVESHTRSHADLRTLSNDQIDEECVAADTEIEQRVGRRPRLFAYPYGLFDARVVAAVASRYEACFTTRMAYLGLDTDRSQAPRLDAYYLQNRWVHERLLTRLVRGYLDGRGWIRSLRGIR